MRYGYRHTAGVITVILLFIIGCITAAHGQVVTGSPNTPSGYSIDSTTGNLIQNSTLTSGTGWNSTGMMGSYTPDGYIFGYVSGTIDQTVNFNTVNFGYQNTSAVFATGIAYGFKYRFQCAQSVGTSCETGTSQDTLNATFTYTLPNGTIETSSSYGLGLKNINDGNPAYNPVWQQLAETYTFTGAKPLNQVGSAKLSITGMDAGFWACNPDCYGPQVKDAYIRLNYSVDPCILNPAFNPSCSGFQNILQGSKSPAFYYSYNIAQSLPHIGGGVVLHGYDYGFNWANYGACYNTFLFWCTDWRTDGGGNINFRISDKNNTTMLQQQWYVGGNNSGGSYSNRYLFTESKNSLDMGSVQWWTSDVWNHFSWVGWTRPIWTPDPCYTNGLYSPNCSNFQDAVNQVLVDIRTQQERIASLTSTSVSSTATTPGSQIITTIESATTTNPSVSVTTIENSTNVQNNLASTGSSSSAAMTASTMTVPSGSSSDSSTSIALDLIRSNQRREQRIATAARDSATNQANQSQQQGQQEAQQLAGMAASANTNSINGSSSQATNETSSRQEAVGVMIGINLPGQTLPTIQLNANSVTRINQSSIANDYKELSGSTRDQNQLFTQAHTPVATTIPVTVSILQTQNQTPLSTVESVSMPADQPTVTSISLPSNQTVVELRSEDRNQDTSPTNFTTNRTNPITAIIENQPKLDQNQTTTTAVSQVNRSVQNNELSGSRGIESIAIIPQGFNAYASLVLRDAAFYTPKEIYRGQRNVDNARALRQLASDRLHQEMVEQQYRR
jgi:hypothetical protein